MRDIIRKIGVLTLMLVLILSTVAPSVFYTTVSASVATPETPDSGGDTSDIGGGGDTSSSANTTRSMLTFFQGERASLQVDRVSKDEILTYGVFLSNFFVPWETTIGDLIKNDSADSLPKRVSTKFFGSEGQSEQVVAINGKLHKGITDSLNGNKSELAMYAKNPSGASGVAPITGQQFYDKISLKDSNQKVYGLNGAEYINFDDPATRASIQVLFGIEPSFLTYPDKGLRTLTGMYMDGVGNVWGSHGSASVDDYVLVLPAVLNPKVYPKKTQFPVSNTFVMGALLKGKEDIFASQTYQTPYYNALDKITDVYDKGNLVSIFGVYSPMNYVGRSDDIINSQPAENPFKSVSSFINESRDTAVNKQNAKILLSVRSDMVDDAVWKAVSNSGDTKQATAVVQYMTATQIFSLDNIADDMYFFNVNNASSENAYDPEEGSFNDMESLVRKTELFTKPQGSGVSFYSNSSRPSPFVTFYSQYLAKGSDADKQAFVKTMTGQSVDFGSAGGRALQSFLDKGTWGTKDDSDILKAMDYLVPTNHVYGLLPASTSAKKIPTSTTLWGMWTTSVYPAAPALNWKDNNLTRMSVATNWFSSTGVKDKTPFNSTKTGGKLSGTSSDTHTRAISTYFHNAMTYRIFTVNNTFAKNLTGSAVDQKTANTPWGAYKNNTSIMDGTNNYAGMYWSLMMSILQIDVVDGKFTDPKPFNNPNLPSMHIDTQGGGLDLNDMLDKGGMVTSEELSLEEQQKDLIKKVHSLLSPEYSTYRNNLIKSYQDSWILSTHRAIIGTWTDPLSVSQGGSGSYASSVSFVNMPTLTDLPLTAWLVDDYIFVYVLIMLFVFMILVLFYLTNRRTLSETLLVGLFLSFVLILPQYLVTGVLQTTDKVGDAVFSEKFDYWAIVQHQQSVVAQADARATGDDLDYIISSNMQDAQVTETKDAGVRLKWMSPKKEDNFKKIFNENTTSNGLANNLTIFRWLFNSTFNQEEYVYNDPLATYIYRPYNSLARAANKGYESGSSLDLNAREVKDTIIMQSENMLGLPTYRFDEFRSTPKNEIVYSAEEQQVLNSIKGVADGDTETGFDGYRYWALGNPEVTRSIFRDDYSTDAGLGVSNTEEASYQAFLLHTESPFYYFYNVIQQRYSSGAGGGDFGSALIDKDTFIASYTNSDADGKVKDFLDLEGLFTYVIPYLRQSNDYVYGWTNLHGKSIEGYNFEKGAAPAEPKDGLTPEELEEATRIYENYTTEKEKKANLEKVWMMYTPWVDSLYDLSTSYNTPGKVAERKVNIEDAINPSSYTEKGRDMIFSEADMRAKSYQYSDLTDIERRMQAVLAETYEDMLYLINYYDFDNEVLVTAGAMAATFNFNAEFSEQRLLGESVTLYPQNYELKNFNYDAYMRLILLNSTGEALMDKTDLYEKVVKKTSIFTGILLLICDILGVIVIPAMKILTVLLLLFLTLAISVSAVISPPEKIVPTIVKQLGVPTGLFMLASVAFTLGVGMFLGDGLDSYVGAQSTSFKITDPSITMSLLIILDLLYIFILFLVVRMLLINLRSHFSTTLFGAVEVVSQAGSHLMNKARNATNMRTSKQRHDEMLDAMRSNGSGQGGQGGPMHQTSGGGNGDGTFKFVKQQTTNSAQQENPSASSLTDEINLKASTGSTGQGSPTRQHDFETETQKSRTRRVGEKFVDLKVGVSSIGRKTGEAKDYVISKEGLISDTKSTLGKGKATIVDGTRNTVQGAKSRMGNAYLTSSEYVSNLRQYEMDKRSQQFDAVSNSKHSSQASINKRQTKIFDANATLSAKQQTSANRRALVQEKMMRKQS